MKKLFTGLSILLLLALSLGCEKLLPKTPESEELLAELVPDLSEAQRDLHLKGDREFARVFAKADGLGPVFVQHSCESCHVGDGKGSPFNNLTRFGKNNPDGTWNQMPEHGGPQLQHRAIAGRAPEQLPAGAVSSDLVAPNVTGLGYLAAVPDAVILAMADSLDSDGDGISGTVNLITPPQWLSPDQRYHQIQPGGRYIGRFGRKAGAIDLRMQTVGAYKQDMGITSEYDPVDPMNYLESSIAGDDVPDPEVPAATVEQIVFYLQTLKAPTRRNADDPEVLRGENIFSSIGCASCHLPSLTTGPSEIASLNEVEFHPYTDMLMHDLGPELDDGYREGSARSFEWRTTPLWGLGLQQFSQGGSMYLLHDGRATSYEQAIEFHGGEGAASRQAFRALSDEEKELLYKFLDSL